MSERITKEFLEGCLGRGIKGLSISTGSNPGDGYTSLMFSLDVSFLDSDKVEYLLLKCYPQHPTRQEILNDTNIFAKELDVYQIWIPELRRFQEEECLSRGVPPQKYQLPFAPFYHGQTIRFTESEHRDESGRAKVFHPLDSYLLMMDLRRAQGFRMAERLIGFDWDHYHLVLVAQAKFHGLSWAYKCKNNISKLEDQFICLQDKLFSGKGRGLFGGLVEQGLKAVLDILRETKGTGSNVYRDVSEFGRKATDILALYFGGSLESGIVKDKDSCLRIPGPTLQNEEPWLVSTHGDCWLNNMLFRYESKGNKGQRGTSVESPVEIMLVDLQLCRENCPTTDLAYCTYTSTDHKFREKHMDAALEIYHRQFMEICTDFRVPPLPNFTLEELKRRFHRARAFGFAMALLGLPIMLNDPSNISDLDTLSEEGEGSRDVAAMISSMTSKACQSAQFRHRVTGMVEELYGAGVI